MRIRGVEDNPLSYFSCIFVRNIFYFKLNFTDLAYEASWFEYKVRTMIQEKWLNIMKRMIDDATPLSPSVAWERRCY